MTIWKVLRHRFLIVFFLIILTSCNSREKKDLALSSEIIVENENNTLQKFQPKSNIEQNQEILKITYEQPNLSFYLFKNEELTFVELPSGRYKNINLDFTYNLSIEQALKEIYFFGENQPGFLVVPTTTEEVFAYEMYNIGKDELEFEGHFSPEDFDFNVNDFQDKNLTLNEVKNQFSIQLVGEKDTLTLKKTSSENSTILINAELKSKIQNLKSQKSSVTNSSEQKSSIDKKYQGNYQINVDTEQTTTGTASVQYKFSISDSEITLQTNTVHEAVSCNGKYEGIEKNNILDLYFIGNESGCDNSSPMFYLKEEKGEIYAKGLGGEATFNEWIKLKRR